MEPFEGLRPGDRIAEKFRVERVLGEGGMGVVYLTEHEVLGERFAIKVLRPEAVGSKEALTRFLNEARAAIRVKNEHIAAVMDVGHLPDGSAYMVMEYLDGKDLAHVLEERGPLPIAEAVDYVLQALEGLAYAHAEGIVHRDLKPANLFLTRARDGEPFVKVLDFGISKLAAQQLAESGQAGVTSTKAMLGSPGYMSPEQVRSSRDVDARSDLWSVGVILYRLLCGAPPFDADTLGGVLASILEDAPPPLRTLRSDVPEALANVIQRCLVKDRAARWQDAYGLAEALAPFGPPESAARIERVRRLLRHGSEAPNLPAPTKRAGSAAVPAVVPTSPTPSEAVISASPGRTAQPPPAPEGAASVTKASPQASDASPSGAQALPPSPPKAPAKPSSRLPLILAAFIGLSGVGVGAYVLGTRGKTPDAPPSSTAVRTGSSGPRAEPLVAAPGASGRAPRARPDAGTGGGQAAAEQAARLREKACKGGSMKDCARLGEAYENGAGVAKDPKRAQELYTEACDQGQGLGCLDLAGLLDEGADGVPEDDARATKLYSKACDLDEPSGCTNAGLSFLAGTGVTEDDRRGVELLQKGCDGDDGQGCYQLGKAYEDGTGVKADVSRAVHFFERGCKVEWLHACAAFGMKLVKGEGVKEDRERGIELLKKACKRVAFACEKLAEMDVSP